MLSNMIFKSIGEQTRTDKKMEILMRCIDNANEYDLDKLIPQVTYDDWIACFNQETNTYCVIALIEHFIYDVKNMDVMALDENGEPLDKTVKDIHTHRESSFCGVTDDMKYWVYFRT